MSKWIRSLALMTALAALSAGTVSVAQEKGKAAKKDAKVGSVEYYKTEKGKWRYRVKDDNGKTIAMPLPTFAAESKDDVLKAIEKLKTILNESKPAEVDEAKKK